MWRHGSRFMDDDKKQHILQRDMVIKLVESAPQAFFQAYVIFALEAHGQPLRVFSLAISIASLSLSLVVSLPELTSAREMFSSKPHGDGQEYDPPSGESVEEDGESLFAEKSRRTTMVQAVAMETKARMSERKSTSQKSRSTKHVGEMEHGAPAADVIGSPLEHRRADAEHDEESGCQLPQQQGPAPPKVVVGS